VEPAVTQHQNGSPDAVITEIIARVKEAVIVMTVSAEGKISVTRAGGVTVRQTRQVLAELSAFLAEEEEPE